MKKLNPSQLIILCLAGVLIYQQFFMGNTYKKEYERMLKEKENEYLSQIEKLESEADSLLQLNLGLSNQIAEIDKDIHDQGACHGTECGAFTAHEARPADDACRDGVQFHHLSHLRITHADPRHHHQAPQACQ